MGVAGWTVVEGFGQYGLRLIDSPLYLILWDEHNCAFALIETINKRIKKKPKKKEQKNYNS